MDKLIRLSHSQTNCLNHHKSFANDSYKFLNVLKIKPKNVMNCFFESFANEWILFWSEPFSLSQNTWYQIDTCYMMVCYQKLSLSESSLSFADDSSKSSRIICGWIIQIFEFKNHIHGKLQMFFDSFANKWIYSEINHSTWVKNSISNGCLLYDGSLLELIIIGINFVVRERLVRIIKNHSWTNRSNFQII